jgi:hypothetical protein
MIGKPQQQTQLGVVGRETDRERGGGAGDWMGWQADRRTDSQILPRGLGEIELERRDIATLNGKHSDRI